MGAGGRTAADKIGGRSGGKASTVHLILELRGIFGEQVSPKEAPLMTYWGREVVECVDEKAGNTMLEEWSGHSRE